MTQAKLNPLILLLGPFVAKNQEIYANDPEMLASFDNLELSDLKIGQITKVDGVHTAHIDSVTRNFVGPDQKWLPASVHSDKVFELVTGEILEDKAAVAEVTVPGVYSYLTEAGESKHIIVIPTGTGADDSFAAAVAVLEAALRYDLPNDQFSLGAGGGTILVNGDTITGEVEFAVAKAAMIVLPEGPIMDLG